MRNGEETITGQGVLQTSSITTKTDHVGSTLKSLAKWNVVKEEIAACLSPLGMFFINSGDVSEGFK